MSEWTYDHPQESGYYWIRPNMEAEPLVVRVGMHLEFYPVKAVFSTGEFSPARIDRVVWLWWHERILSPDEIPVVPIDALPLPNRALNALRAKGLDTVYKASKLSEKQLSLMEGISTKTAREITDAIKAHKTGLVKEGQIV